MDENFYLGCRDELGSCIFWHSSDVRQCDIGVSAEYTELDAESDKDSSMFELFGLLFKLFIYTWIGIIAVIPQIIMGGLFLCLGATLLTYLPKNKQP